MSNLEKYMSEQIKKIVPTFDKLELRTNVGDTSYSVEFFVTTSGEKMQCYDMVDDGLIKEKDLDAVFESIAKYIRQTSDYQKGKINKISTVIVR